MTPGTIIGWHLGHVGPQLASSIGWRYLAAPSPTQPVQLPAGRVVLVGYSLGCVGLRETLRQAPGRPEAVVTIDGTHSSIGPGALVAPAHLAVWRPLAARARAGEVLFLATTLGAHRYTERLGGRSFASTGKVLEHALGFADGYLATPREHADGGLVVRSYPSADTDKAAHIAQVREVLPAVFGQYVAPWLSRGGADPIQPSVDPIPASVDPVADTDPAPAPGWDSGLYPDARLGLRALAWLGFAFGLGAREFRGPAHNPLILAFSRACRRGGTFLGVDASGLARWLGGTPLPLGRDEDPWCAAIASASLLGAMRPGDAPPHGLRVSVRELVEDARAVGSFRGPDHMPRPGDLGIDGRAGGDPTRAGTGHVWRVLEVRDGIAHGIGGNENDAINLAWRPIASKERKGWIVYP